MAWAIALGYLLYSARPALFTGQATIDHDNLLFFYPVYQFFAESLLQGRFPYWDPFSHGGSALYPTLLQLRLLEPVSYLVVGLGGLLTHDLVTLFNWDRLARTLLGAVGTYMLLRSRVGHPGARLLLVPMVTWSSLVLAAFHQTAIIDQYITGPWFAYFLLRVAHDGDGRWRNWLGLALSVGVSWQSYYFGGIWILALFLAVGFVLLRRQDIRALLGQRRLGAKIGTALAVVALMALPNAVVLAERGSYVLPARMMDHPVAGRTPLGGPLQYEPRRSEQGIDALFMPYALVQYTGTFSSPWDFVQLLAPAGNRFARGEKSGGTFGMPSEAFMYVGLLGYVGALFGLVAGQHPLKGVWLIATAGFGALLLGPAGGLHRILHIYPPLWGIRHTHALVSFFVMGLLFFFVIGLNRLLEHSHDRPVDDHDAGPVVEGWWHAVPLIQTAMLGVILWLLGTAILRSVAILRALPHFNWEAGLVLLVPLVVWGAYRWLGGIHAMAGVLIAHVALVLQHTPRGSEAPARLLLLLALPLLALVVARLAFPRLWPIALMASALVLVLDLGTYVGASSWLWHWRRPDEVLRIVARPQPPALPGPRSVVLPSTEMYRFYPQPIRYLTLVTRRPAAFSSLMYGPDVPEAYFTSTALPVPNRDLSAWRMRDGGWQPDGWEAVPREGAQPAAHSAPPAATSAARLVRVPSRASELRLKFHVPGDAAQLWVKVPVRSSNAALSAIEAELVFGASRVLRTYLNSGQWETLTLAAGGRGPMALTVRLKPGATDDALVGPVSVRAASPDEPAGGRHFDLGLVRASARWNSFLMPARYFAMINGPLPDVALEELLAIGQPLVQFRAAARVASADEMIAILRAQPEEEMRRTLREVVYLHDTAPAMLLGARRPADTKVRVARYDYNALRIAVDSSEGGYIVLAQGFDRHWKGFEAGRPVLLIPANLAFTAVPVGPGRHDIRLRYSPDLFRAALVVYFGVATVTAGVLLVCVARRG